jgi:hypothetical protein
MSEIISKLLIIRHTCTDRDLLQQIMRCCEPGSGEAISRKIEDQQIVLEIACHGHASQSSWRFGFDTGLVSVRRYAATQPPALLNQPHHSSQ